VTAQARGETQLIGVVVEVPPPFEAALHRYRKQFDDPTADLIPAHVTLVRPLEVPVDSVPAIAAHLRTVAAGVRPFDVHLSGTQTFRPLTPTVYVEIVAGVAEFTELARLVNSGPLSHTPEFDYRPHVTIAHFVSDHLLDAAASAASDFEAEFTATELGLYEPGDDGRWVRVLDAPFGG